MMFRGIVNIRLLLQRRLSDLEFVELFFETSPRLWQIPVYILLVLGRTFYSAVLFVVSIPIHIAWSPQHGFQLVANRKPNGEFLDSYSGYVRGQRLSVVALVGFFLVIAIQVFLIEVSLYEAIKPTRTRAVSSSVTLNPTWDRTGYRADSTAPMTCDVTGTLYNCESATSTLLKVARDFPACEFDDTYYRAAMKFSLTSIPDNATVTDVDLTVNVTNTSAATLGIFRVSTDTPDTVSCTTAGSSLYEKLGENTNYLTTSNWNTTGSKTYDLGATADSDVQSRLSGSDLIAIGLRDTAATNDTGIYNSVDSASNKPQLVIAYTTPPEAPTNASHSSNTTTGITWTWTDNATADTSNVIHDSGHAVKCTAAAISGTGSTGSCSEGGLSANTQYARHPNAIDAQGNTDGPSASVYTSIETPSGITFGSVTQTGITVSASGTLSNLTAASSSVFLQENVTSTNSGWTQTNSWTKSGLTANTQYSFQAKARNGDGDETALTAVAAKYTLSVAPDVRSARSTSTWYTSSSFEFTNNAAWVLVGYSTTATPGTRAQCTPSQAQKAPGVTRMERVQRGAVLMRARH